MPDAVAVRGRIAERWLWWGGAGGPFGPAVAGEETVPGHSGVRQRFERGEIAWSPEQDMLTSVFLLRNEACLEWSRPGMDFDYFRYDIEIDGVGQGQAAMKTAFEDVHPEDELLIWTRLQGFGEYTFVVKSCVHHTIGADECHGWTVPLRLSFQGLGASPFPTETPVDGVLGERWHELGAWTGPLGHAITHAAIDEDAGGLVQVFEHGVLQTAPALGPRMVMAGYQRMLPDAGSEYAHPSIELNWGGSDIAFDTFRVDVLFNGRKLEDVSGHVRPSPTEWGRTFNGSGQFQMRGPHATGAYFFHVFAAEASNPAQNVDLQTTPAFRVGVLLDSPDQSQIQIELPALDATPAAAFASHRDRTLSIVRDYARTRPLRVTFTGR